MREISFIKKNKSKWLELEQSLNQKQSQNPDELADAYIQLINDLSYSQTYYPKSKTTEYLNFLVTQIYRKIYKTKRLEKNRLKSFFWEEIPSLVYQYRKQMIFAFALFFFFVALGAISAAYDDRFVRIILGDEYVNMTLENILDLTGEMEHLNELIMLSLDKEGGFTSAEAYFTTVQPILDLLEVEIRVRCQAGMSKNEMKLIIQDWIDCEIRTLQ